MNKLSRFTPKLLLRFDKYLLLNYPALWNLKLHTLLYMQALCAAIMIPISYGYGATKSDFADVDFFAGVLGTLVGLVTLGWLFLSHRFDIRLRLQGKPVVWEFARMLSYAWAFAFFCLVTFGSQQIIWNQNNKQFTHLTGEEFDELTYYIAHFKRYSREIAENHLSDPYFIPYSNTLANEYPAQLSEQQVIEYFETLSDLNVQYGNGEELNAAELRNQARAPEWIAGSDNWPHILYQNVQRAISARWHLSRHWHSDDYVALYATFLSIFGLLGALIYYYKFFGIQGLISGILAPGVIFLILVLLAFIMQLNGTSDHKSVYVILLVFISLGLLSLKDSVFSRFRLFAYQTISLSLAMGMAFFYSEEIYDHERTERMEILSRQIPILTILVFSFYSFVLVPLYHYGLYRLFIFPRK